MYKLQICRRTYGRNRRTEEQVVMAEFKRTKSAMKRLGFETMEEYKEYLEFLEMKKAKKKDF